MTVNINLDGDEVAAVMRGLADLTAMLNCIGSTDDHGSAKILVEGEMNLRALQKYALLSIARLVDD